jgi:uncharacterized membrane protein
MRHFSKSLAVVLALSMGLSGLCDRADAKSSSGGRSRGGSFSSPSRSSGSSGGNSRPSQPSRSNSDRNDYREDYRYRDNYRPSYGYGYSSGYGRSSSSDGFWLALILVLGVVGVIGYLLWKAQQNSGKGAGELGNETVTVSKIQVALLAQERNIQDRLSELTENADMDTAEGRSEMLRECVLALLRSPDTWSHVYSSSQVVKSRDAAGKVFEQWSMAERSKVDAETLVNVGGKVRRQAIATEDADPGSYIVVTLLVGTENDRSLFDTVHTTEDLKTALENLGALSTEYLLILELLWNPQSSKESLTYDEMLAHYSELVPLG